MRNLIMIVLALALTACYSAPPEAIEHAKDQAAANHRHATNPKLSPVEQLIGQANEDQWNVQAKLLDPDHQIPLESQKRIDAARAARARGGSGGDR